MTSILALKPQTFTIFVLSTISPHCLNFPAVMRQTHQYSASQYVGDNGFPLTWICRCCLSSGAQSTMREDIEENHQRSKTQPGKIVGRPAGHPQAYVSHEAMRFQQKVLGGEGAGRKSEG
jgi:hypothetical protein